MFNARILLPALLVCLVAGSGFAQQSDSRSRAWIGVNVETLSPEMASNMRLDVNYGARVNDVTPNSPAQEAGLQADDIIIRLDGQRVDDANDIVQIADRGQPGDRVSMTVIRDRQRQQLSLTYGDLSERRGAQTGNPDVSTRSDRGSSDTRGSGRESNQETNQGDMNQGTFGRGGTGSNTGTTEGPFIGVRLTQLNDQLADYFGVVNGRGALVAEVVNGSPAHNAGLRAGDVIVAVDDQNVSSPREVAQLVQNKSEGSTAILSLVRDRRTQTAQVAISGWSGQSDSWGTDEPTMGPGDPDREQPDLGRSDDNTSMGLRQEVDQLRREVEILRRQVDDLEQRVEEP